jgi:signal transduction histidine kinase
MSYRKSSNSTRWFDLRRANASWQKRLEINLLNLVLSVPVRFKIIGIVMLPVLILGFTLNYWIKSGLSDWLSYLLSNERVRVAMSAGSRSVIFVTLLAAVTSILFALVLIYLLTRPLLDLNDVAQEVANGNLTARVPVLTRDEIGEVARSVNMMIDRLVASQEKLEQANRRLESLNRVAMAASRELELDEVLQAVLIGMLEVLDLKSGWAYLLDTDTRQFYLASQVNLPIEIKDLVQTQDYSVLCSCQNDLLNGNITSNVSFRPGCKRLDKLGGQHNEFTHLTIPIRVRGQNLGLINLLCHKSDLPSEENLNILSAIGAQASEIVTNAWLYARLVEKEAARKALLESLVRTQEDERARLARELHDGAGQSLTSLLVRLKALEMHAMNEPIKTGLSETLDLLSETIGQVREMSYQLHPPTLEEFGLAKALENLLEEMLEDSGLVYECRFELEGVTLRPEIETALYRIAQEALTNIIRHASANHIHLDLGYNQNAICMCIEDDGVGFEPENQAVHSSGRHLGLIGMQERIEMLGGSLAIFSSPGAGTKLQVQVPLELVEISQELSDEN